MKVAAIIPSYFYADKVSHAINSLITQSRPLDEIIVVDDCSKDGSMAEYKKYAGLIQLFQTKSNYGPAEAKNLGVFHSSADIDIIAFLDADDIYQYRMIEDCLKVFEKYPNVGLVYTDAGEYDYDHEITRLLYREPYSLERHMSTDIIGGNFVVRKSEFSKIGGFDPEMRVGENYDLTRRMLARTLAAHIPNPLVSCTISHRALRRKIDDRDWEKSLQRTYAKSQRS